MKAPLFLPVTANILLSTFVAAETDTYLGFKATGDNNADLALCGENLYGCLAVTITSSNHGSSQKCQKSHLSLGPLAEIGTPPQLWKHTNGRFQSVLSPERCLVPRTPRTTLQVGESHPLSVQPCHDNDNNNDRFLLREDGRIQSLLPYLEEPFCVTIQGSEEMIASAGGSSVTLEACDDDNDLQQVWLAIGRTEDFLSTAEKEYGREDVIELGFYRNMDSNETKNATSNLEIYLAADMILSSEQEQQPQADAMPIFVLEHSLGQSELIRLNASDLLLNIEESSASHQYFVATLGSLEVEFSISLKLAHTCNNSKNNSWNQYRSVSDSPLTAAVIVIVLVMVFVALIGLSFSLKMKRQALGDSEILDDKTETSELEDEDLDKLELDEDHPNFNGITSQSSVTEVSDS